MQMTLLPQNSGYTPSYKWTDITDDLHNVFGFHTNYEFIFPNCQRLDYTLNRSGIQESPLIVFLFQRNDSESSADFRSF